MERNLGTYPELLARVDALQITDKAVEQKAGLPQSFLSRARHGKCGGPKAAATWGKLLAWLEGAKPEKAEPLKPVAVVPQPIADAVDKANSFKALGKVLKMLTSAVIRGEMDRFTAAALEGLLRERRQVLMQEAEEQSRMDSGRPVVIEVQWSRDWREVQ